MQPPPTGFASVMARSLKINLPSPRGEARVGEIQAIDQDADEGAVELAAAGDARLLEVGETDAQGARVGAGGDGGAARLAARREVSHLAEALAGAEHGEQLLVLAHPHLAFDQDAEEVADLAFMHHLLARGP